MSAAIPDDDRPDGQPDDQPAARQPLRRDGRTATPGFWAPVLRVAAERVLDDLAPHLDGRGGAQLLDVGTGTGTLAIAALERWPGIRVTGIDPSGGMLEVGGRDGRRATVGRGAAAVPAPRGAGGSDALRGWARSTRRCRRSCSSSCRAARRHFARFAASCGRVGSPPGSPGSERIAP